MRIAHLTATFPPYPGGAGNTCYRFAKGQAERGHDVEVFTAPAQGEPPDPGGARVHRVEPLLAIGNAPLIPTLARIQGRPVGDATPAPRRALPPPPRCACAAWSARCAPSRPTLPAA